VSQIRQDPFRIGRDGENGEILKAQRNTEAYLSSTARFEGTFLVLSTHATETSSVASHGQTMPGIAGKTLSSYA